jgi:hypothetical protein
MIGHYHLSLSQIPSVLARRSRLSVLGPAGQNLYDGHYDRGRISGRELDSEGAWRQPILRLIATVVGIGVGVMLRPTFLSGSSGC